MSSSRSACYRSVLSMSSTNKIQEPIEQGDDIHRSFVNDDTTFREQVDDMHRSSVDDATPCKRTVQRLGKQRMEQCGCSCKASASFTFCPPASSTFAVEPECMTHNTRQSKMEDMASLGSLYCDPSYSASCCGNHVMPCMNSMPIEAHPAACRGSSCPASVRSTSPDQRKKLKVEEQEDKDRDEDDDSGCVTPRAPEHQIPDPPEQCPPPPRKKMRRSEHTVNRIGQNAGATSMEGFSNFFCPPPDLHTYPDCIRILFES